MFGFDEKKNYDDDDTSSVDLNGRPFDLKDVLVCTTHGKIYAISKTDGSRYWRQKFPGGAYGSLVSVFISDSGKVILGCNGKTACIDLYTGETKWVNKMKGMGIEEVGVVCSISQQSPAIQDRTEGGDDQLPSYEGSTVEEKQVVFGCTRGKVVAIDADSGEELWRYNCPGGGYNIPSLLIEPTQQGSSRWPFQVLYAGCGKWIYCLRVSTGEVLWTNRISSSKFGLGMICMATPWTSRVRAELYTDFSNTPHAQFRELERRRHSSNGGG
ncbi:Quino protein alcohol dehydrogenase-like protein [Hesseltinella vesiculosa]|uniref:Quino protein alcohol dehydrogenase-like protein n=1 Tax=Hesseltinella vesiculosa TaxID=101127 RepID=A0A1X2G2T4_9FUNG|nr:Quino protein alcohol dehydrogenase-like protein [Hesseltinella vesiculosa]